MNALFYTSSGSARLLPTGVLVLLATLAMSIRVPNGALIYKSNEVLTVVVPIAGTLVALALPAAQLAQSILENFLSSAQELIKGNRPIPDVVRYLETAALERKRDLAGIHCVVMFSVASLMAGLFGIFGPVRSGELPADSLVLRDFLASFATTSLVASVLWLLPVIQSSFSFAKVDKLINLLRGLSSLPPSPAQSLASPVVALTPPAPPSGAVDEGKPGGPTSH